MLPQRLKKLILLRLLLATLLLYGPKIFPGSNVVAVYVFSVSVSFLSFVYLVWYLTRWRYRWLAYVQFAGDVVLVTYLVGMSGGAESIFVTLYVLSILCSALVVGEMKFVWQMTVLSCLCYFVASLAAMSMRTADLLLPGTIYLYYGMTVRIIILFVVGQLSCYLSHQVQDLQSKLKLSERLSSLGEVVSKISHEIRNPLSAICTAAEVLKDSLQGKLDHQEERMLSIIGLESVRLTKTLQRILNYAKQVNLNQKMLLLDDLVNRTVELASLQSRDHSNGILVEKLYETSQTHIYADEEQIVGAFLNLVLNAHQAMPQGGKLYISAQEDIRGTKIDIKDTGGGIPKEKLGDLFQPFKSSKKGGTGLGLAEVHKIITLHEGKVEVETESGKGTTFHLYFPKP